MTDVSRAGPARVRSLDVTLANQIAAGEVVERPASVLKELLENAIDAGAGRIEVHAERGGIASLRVSDDGAGIHHDDLQLALQRHATSKIATLDDLESVVSMGFRGEALPSIASVSRLQITSRVHAQETAWRISAEGGSAQGVPIPASHPPGTSVLVRELFFNTPVRRRFLRTPRTEMRHMDRVFRRIALAAFPVAMSFHHDGRELVRVASATHESAILRRVGRLLGERFAAGTLAIERGGGGMRLSGWLGSADTARERNDQQYLYINGRAVSDSTVRHAVRLAYGSLIGDSQHPCWLLYLELDPREVDVNVHPTKQEVRFREARMIHDFVRAGAREVLANRAARPTSNAVHAQEPSAGYGRAHGGQVERMPSPGSVKVLALLADGLLVARRDEEFLLARCADLLRALAEGHLNDIARGARAAVARPLLLPERLSTVGSVLDDERAVQLLETFGFSLRRSAEHSVLVLAVPETLSRVPAQRWQSVFAADGGPCDDAQHWLRRLTAVAAEQPLRDLDAAAAVLAQLTDVDEGDAPWVVLDARRAAHLFAATATAQ